MYRAHKLFILTPDTEFKFRRNLAVEHGSAPGTRELTLPHTFCENIIHVGKLLYLLPFQRGWLLFQNPIPLPGISACCQNL